MTNEKKTPDDVIDPTPHDSGQTTPVLNDGLAPRLPHERDESADSQTSMPREVMIQAQKDLERGLVDTDRGPVLDDLYENAVRPAGEATPGRGAADKKDSRGQGPAP